jgi:nitrite reductase/ring-hydroxylating ferredoxin subunit
VVDSGSGWHFVAEVIDIPDAESCSVDVDGTRVCLVRDGNAFHALADICTHGFAFLSEGYCDVADGVVECPLHGGLFNFRTGAAVGTPADRDAQVYEVKVTDGRVFVKVDAV